MKAIFSISWKKLIVFDFLFSIRFQSFFFFFSICFQTVFNPSFIFCFQSAPLCFYCSFPVSFIDFLSFFSFAYFLFSNLNFRFLVTWSILGVCPPILVYYSLLLKYLGVSLPIMFNCFCSFSLPLIFFKKLLLSLLLFLSISSPLQIF